MSRSSRRHQRQKKHLQPGQTPPRTSLRVEALEERVVPYSTPISGTGGAITDRPSSGGSATTNFDIVISEHFDVQDLNVSLNITHTANSHLTATLRKVGTSTSVVLFDTLTGANLSGTTLDDEAATALTTGAAPYTGTFRPKQALSAFDPLTDAAGTWRLSIQDDTNGQAGTLNSWSLDFSGPDLVATVSVVSATARSDGTVDVVVNQQVTNQGRAASTATTLEFFLADDNGPTFANPTYLNSINVGVLAAGASTTATNTTINVDAADFLGHTSAFLGYVLDRADTVKEEKTGESNNEPTTGLYEFQPDFAIKTFSASIQSTTATTVTLLVNYSIENVGALPAAPSFAVYLVNAAGAQTGTNNPLASVSSTTIGTINPGASTTTRQVTVTVERSEIAALTAPGISFKIDPANTIIEANETNNTPATNPFSFQSDLTVTGTAISTPDGTGGVDIDLTYLVSNGGLSQAPTSTLVIEALDDNGTVIKTLTTRSIVALAAGATASNPANLSANLTAAEMAGTTKVTVRYRIDPANLISESNETNNSDAQVAVLPDVVATVTVVSATARSDGSVDVVLNAQVTNQGLVNSTATKLEFAVADDNGPTFANSTLLTDFITVGALAAGATATTSNRTINVKTTDFNGRSPAFLTYVLDRANTVIETTAGEANNEPVAAVYEFLPDFTIKTFSATIQSTTATTVTLLVNYSIENVGALPDAPALAIYLVNAAGTPIGTHNPLATVSSATIGTITPGASRTGQVTVTVERSEIAALTAPGISFKIDPANTIIEANETNNTPATNPFSFQSDLTVTGTAISTPDGTGGVDIDLTYLVSNVGLSQAPASTLVIEALDDNGTVIKTLTTRSIVALAAGATASGPANLSANLTAAEMAGTTKVTVRYRIDPANLISESDETNNSAAVAAVLPDVVATVTVVSATARSDGSVDVVLNAQVTNQGLVNSTATKLEFAVTDDNGPTFANSTLLTDFITVGALAAGATATMSNRTINVKTTDFNGRAPAFLTYVLDRANTVIETTAGEANNEPTTAVYEFLPDFTIKTFSATIQSTTATTVTLLVNYSIENVGALPDAPAFAVYLVNAAGTPIGTHNPLASVSSTTIGTINPGASTTTRQVTVTVDRTEIAALTAPGISFKIDPANTIIEANETNNTPATNPFSFQSDLTVTGTAISTPDGTGGVDIDLTYLVSNGGLSQAPTSTLVIEALDDNGTVIKTLDSRSIVALAAGATASNPANLSANLTAAEMAGTTKVTVRYRIDPANLISESDETNNSAAVAAVLPDVVATVTVVSATARSDGSVDVVLNAQVTNQGLVNSTATKLEFAVADDNGPTFANKTFLSSFINVGALAAGATATTSNRTINVKTTDFNGRSPAFLTYVLDRANTVIETTAGEANNEPATGLYEFLPDFTIKTFSATIQSTTATTVTLLVDYSIENKGTLQGAPELAILLVNAAGTPIGTHNPLATVLSTTIGTINPGASTATGQVTITVDRNEIAAVTAPGISFKIDPNNLLAELNELNNSPPTVPFSFQSDLTVTGTVTATPDGTGGVNLDLAYVVSNVGLSQAPTSTLVIEALDDNGTVIKTLDSRSIAALAAGATASNPANLSANLTAAEMAGTTKVTVRYRIDPANLISESNETNNSDAQVAVLPDVVATVTVVSATARSDGSVDVVLSERVTNQGFVSSTATTLEFAVADTNGPTFTNKTFLSSIINVAALAPGASTATTFRTINVKTTDFNGRSPAFLTYVLDRANTVIETTAGEANNEPATGLYEFLPDFTIKTFSATIQSTTATTVTLLVDYSIENKGTLQGAPELAILLVNAAGTPIGTHNPLATVLSTTIGTINPGASTATGQVTITVDRNEIRGVNAPGISFKIDPNNLLAELNELNNSPPTVPFSFVSDLTVSGTATATQNGLLGGLDFALGYTVTNSGVSRAGASTLVIEAIADDNSVLAVLATESIGAIDAGTNITGTVGSTPNLSALLLSGTTKVTVRYRIDPANLISESNETNNTSDVASVLPDVVATVTVVSATARSDGSVDVVLSERVTNQGFVSSTATTLEFAVADTNGPTFTNKTFLSSIINVAALAPGASTATTFRTINVKTTDINGRSPAFLTYVLDRANTVIETTAGEANNEPATGLYEFLPDFTIKTFSATIQSTTATTVTLLVDYSIENKGTLQGAPELAILLVNAAGTPIGTHNPLATVLSTTIGTINPGASTATGQVTITVDRNEIRGVNAPGISFKIDPNNLLTELNELNNSPPAVPFSFGSDLTVTGTVTATPNAGGLDFAFAYTVNNSGLSQAGASTLVVEAVLADGTLVATLGTQVVGPVNAQGSVSGLVTLPGSLSSGQLNGINKLIIRYRIDATNVIPESNELNNASDIRTLLPNLQLASSTVTPSLVTNATSDVFLNVAYQVQNVGLLNSAATTLLFEVVNASNLVVYSFTANLGVIGLNATTTGNITTLVPDAVMKVLGSATLRSSIDPLNNVEEADETNNKNSIFTFLPDLTPVLNSFQAADPVRNSNTTDVLITGAIANIGFLPILNAPGGKIVVAFDLLDENNNLVAVGVDTLEVLVPAGLAINGTLSFSGTIQIPNGNLPRGQKRFLRGRIDPLDAPPDLDGQITEHNGNEVANNITTDNVRLLPDLNVKSFELLQFDVVNGQPTVRIRYEVENIGALTADAFSVTLVLSSNGNLIDDSDEAVYVFLNSSTLTTGQSTGVVVQDIPLSSAVWNRLSQTATTYLGLRVNRDTQLNPVGTPPATLFDEQLLTNNVSTTNFQVFTDIEGNLPPLVASLKAALIGVSNSGADVDAFDFVVSQTGTWTARLADRSGATPIARITLQGPNGKVLVTEDAFGQATQKGELVQLLTPGAYRLLVTPAAANLVTGPRAYQVWTDFDTTVTTQPTTPDRSLTLAGEAGELYRRDLNNDGYLDLIAVNPGSAFFSVYLGLGDGTFLPEQQVNWRSSATATQLLGTGLGTLGTANLHAITFQDFNNDGRLDVAVSEGRFISISYGIGDGTFRFVETLTTANPVVTAGTANFVALVADVYFDLPTLFALDAVNGRVHLFRPDGSGHLQGAGLYQSGAAPSDMILAQLDGGRGQDLAILSEANNTLTILVNRGDGSLIDGGAARTIALAGDPTRIRAVATGSPSGMDIAVLDSTTGNEKQVSVKQFAVDSTTVPALDFTTGQTTSDGDAPLLFIRRNGAQTELVNIVQVNNGGFLIPTEVVTALSANFASVITGNFNKDGTTDVAYLEQRSGQPDRLIVLLGQANGTFKQVLSGLTPPRASAPALIDLNQDGKLDLLYVTENGDVFWRPALTDPNPRDTVFPGPYGVATQIAGIGKASDIFAFDYNGIPFLAVASLTPSSTTGRYPLNVFNLTRDASGKVVANSVGFTGSLDAPGFFAQYDQALAGVIQTDLTGDAFPEFVVVSPTTGTLTIFTSPGFASFAFYGFQTLTFTGQPTAALVTDLDGDGDGDIVLTDSLSGEVSILRNTGGNFEPVRRYHATPGAFGLQGVGSQLEVTSAGDTRDVIAGEFSGDAFLDLIVFNRGTGQLQLLESNGATGFLAPRTVVMAAGEPALLAHRQMVSANLLGDGTAYIVLLGQDGETIQIVRTAGVVNNALTLKEVTTVKAGLGLVDLRFQDTNGDGKLDLLVTNAQGDVEMLLGSTKTVGARVIPTYLSPYKPTAADANGELPPIPLDFNRDGKDDDAALRLFLGTGIADENVVLFDRTGVRAPVTILTKGLLREPGVEITWVDINQDGLLDALVSNKTTNTLDIYLNDSNILQKPTRHAVGSEPGTIAVADLNGDRALDIVVRNLQSQDASIFFGSPSPPNPRLPLGGQPPYLPLTYTVSPASRVKTGPGAQIALRDVPLPDPITGVETPDGLLDIVVGDINAAEFGVVPGRGQGFFDDRDGSRVVRTVNPGDNPFFNTPSSLAGVDLALPEGVRNAVNSQLGSIAPIVASIVLPLSSFGNTQTTAPGAIYFTTTILEDRRTTQTTGGSTLSFDSNSRIDSAALDVGQQFALDLRLDPNNSRLEERTSAVLSFGLAEGMLGRSGEVFANLLRGSDAALELVVTLLSDGNATETGSDDAEIDEKRSLFDLARYMTLDELSAKRAASGRKRPAAEMPPNTGSAEPEDATGTTPFDFQSGVEQKLDALKGKPEKTNANTPATRGERSKADELSGPLTEFLMPTLDFGPLDIVPIGESATPPPSDALSDVFSFPEAWQERSELSFAEPQEMLAPLAVVAFFGSLHTAIERKRREDERP